MMSYLKCTTVTGANWAGSNTGEEPRANPASETQRGQLDHGEPIVEAVRGSSVTGWMLRGGTTHTQRRHGLLAIFPLAVWNGVRRSGSFAEVWVNVALTQQGAVEHREGTQGGVTLRVRAEHVELPCV